MKKLFTIISGLIFFSSSISIAMGEKYEASMNLDSENVRPFLTELNAKFDLGFGLEINKMVRISESIEVNEEESIFIYITSDNAISIMEFHVFMSSIDAPDLYFFFEQAKLAYDVSDFMVEWAEARGM